MLHSATTEQSVNAQKTRTKMTMKRGHKCLTWKPQMWEKTTAVHKLQNTLWERTTTTRIHRGNDLLSSSSPHAKVTVEAKTSHSLSLSLTLSLYTRAIQLLLQKCSTTYNNVLCPKSYLYIYDFRVIYTCVPSNRRTDRNRVFGFPVLHNFHPGGHVSQQTPPSLRHGMSL